MANLGKDYYLDEQGLQTLVNELETNLVALEYSTSATYAVGDYCVHDNKMYRCTTAISTAESWNSDHWTLVIISDELKSKKPGTVTSVTIKGTSPIVSSSSSAITTSGTRTISHANSGVTPGDYTKVTVNATGHVTDGSNPTTLSGYGITDAKIESGTITLGSDTITPLTSHQTVTDGNPTLDWSTQSTVATIGSTDIHVTMPSNPNTDKSVTAVATDPTSTTGYYPIMVTGATNQQPKYSSKSAFKFNITNGTASDNGWSSICIGNNIASGTANNMKGYLTLYSAGTYRTNLSTNTITANTDVYLPTTSGTLALTSQIPTITDTYSGTSSDGMSGKAVKSAIDALDGGTIGTPSASKTLTALSQTNGNISATFADIAIANTQVSGLGTASVKNVPASGNASSTEVVMGNDTRLTDSRTPTSHSHGNIANGGTIASTAVTPASNDYILISDNSSSGTANKIERGIKIGTSTTTFLNESGKWSTPVGTTYTDGTGITIGAGNVINHSNSITAQTTQAVYPVKIDAQGHITAVGTAATILALGNGASNAYYGDKGKTAYDHSQVTSGNPHNVTKSDVGLGNVGNFKAVSTVASQGLTTTEKSNARTNIGAGTGSVTSVTIKGSSPIISSSETAITGSGTVTLSHDTSGATSGSYGDSSAQTPAYGATFKVPYITVDTYGHVTAISDHTVKIPASDNTDEKVKQSNTTATSWRKLVLGSQSSTIGTATTETTAQVYVTPKLEFCPDKNVLSVGAIRNYYGAIQTGETKASHITLQTLMTWLISTQKWIPSDFTCHLFIHTTTTHADNDILQFTAHGTNYECQLSGCHIEYMGYSTGYNAGQFRLIIHNAPKNSFTVAEGYTKMPVSSIAEYWCTGSSNNPVWKLYSFGGKTVGTTSIGSASTGTAIPADDITSWTTNTPTAVTKKTVVTSASYSGGILTLNTGDSCTVTAGVAADLQYTPKSIPNISVTSTTVATAT